MNLNEEQGVAAEIEKAVVEADLIEAEGTRCHTETTQS